LLGTLMGMQKGNNTAKVLETSEWRECIQLTAECSFFFQLCGAPDLVIEFLRVARIEQSA
jgi:hypothetical protein